ncbi:unnamed protein product, partial [Clonostachys byssicola]
MEETAWQQVLRIQLYAIAIAIWTAGRLGLNPFYLSLVYCVVAAIVTIGVALIQREIADKEKGSPLECSDDEPPKPPSQRSQNPAVRAPPQRGSRDGEDQGSGNRQAAPENQPATSSNDGPPKPPPQRSQNAGVRASPQRGRSNENLSTGSGPSINASTGLDKGKGVAVHAEDDEDIPLARLLSPRSSLARERSNQSSPGPSSAAPAREDQGKVSVKVLFHYSNFLAMQMRGGPKVDLTDLRICRRHSLKGYPGFVNFPVGVAQPLVGPEHALRIWAHGDSP